MSRAKCDRTGLFVRLGCGAVFGMIPGFSLALFFADSAWGFAGVVLAMAVLMAVLAARYGDRFWDSIGDWLF